MVGGKNGRWSGKNGFTDVDFAVFRNECLIPCASYRRVIGSNIHGVGALHASMGKPQSFTHVKSLLNVEKNNKTWTEKQRNETGLQICLSRLK